MQPAPMPVQKPYMAAGILLSLVSMLSMRRTAKSSSGFFSSIAITIRFAGRCHRSIG